MNEPLASTPKPKKSVALSGVTAGIALSQNQNSGAGTFNSRPTASSAMSEALGQQLGHSLAVIHVHLAAEAFDFESLGSHLTSPIGDW